MNRNTKLTLGIGLTVAGAGLIAAALYYRRKNALGLGSSRVPILAQHTDAQGKTVTHYQTDRLSLDDRVGLLQDLVFKSVKDPEMMVLARKITNVCPARDGLCEAAAIDQWIRQHIRYTGDVAPVMHGAGGVYEPIDYFASARRIVEMGGGDCLPVETLVLRDDYTLVPLVDLDPGDRIMSEGSWTTVQERWITGEKAILALELSNGCTLRVTPEHRIFRDVEGRVEEIRAGEARVGDDLIVGSTVPFSETPVAWPPSLEKLSAEDRAWLLGTYVADGWADGKTRLDGTYAPYRASISGLDGHPKEEQKRRVVALMDQLGIATRWHRKYVAINDSPIARFFSAAGKRAYEKALPQLACASEAETRAFLQGLAADSDVRGVFGTTSPTLALQLRILHRMLGIGTHIKRVDHHGGFGAHPIYRVTPRLDDTRRDKRFARVRAIQDGGLAMCADLTTDQGKFWLPESDVLVHNCDEHSVLAATLLTLNGIESRFRVTAPGIFSQYGHIYVVAGLPKGANGSWLAMDTTLPAPYQFGDEMPYGKKRDYIPFVKEFAA